MDISTVTLIRNTLVALSEINEAEFGKLICKLNMQLRQLESLQNKPSTVCLKHTEYAVIDNNQTILEELNLLQEKYRSRASLDFARVQKNVKELLQVSQQTLYRS